MSKINNLTEGNISKAIWSMALPLISTSFIQMAYNLTDMLWLGRVGSESVAAVGAAGFFVWFCNAVSIITKTGSEITISQSIGAKDHNRARSYASQSVILSVTIGILISFILFVLAPLLVRGFKFDPHISVDSIKYLQLVAPGIFFQFNNSTFTGLYNGQGNSKTPFKITVVGLIANMILDPLFIFGWGPIPRLNSDGAAIATSLSQLIVFLIFIYHIYIRKFPLGKIKFLGTLKKGSSLKILSLGFPVSIQSALFSMFSLTLATLAARWGAVGVAVLSIGSQIEAISWMTAGGFSTALAAFTGQNYGAGLYERISKGYKKTMITAGSVGLSAGILFFLFNEEIFSIFIKEPETIRAGGEYLKILAISQLFMVTEGITTGAFNGTGRTIPPSLSGIVLTAVRIPLAYYLCTFPALGLNGIWLSITISSILKGTILPLWFWYSFIRKFKN